MNKNFEGLLREKKVQYQRWIQEEIHSFFKQEYKKIWGKKQISFNLRASLRESLSAPIRDFFDADSKKLRPILGYLLMKCFKSPSMKYEKCLILPEILHGASLITDDIEDGALLRRNAPAFHIKFGLDTAINAANALYFIPFTILKRIKIPHAMQKQLENILLESLNRIHVGQGLDILWHKKASYRITPEEYVRMTKLKTSSFFRSEVQIALLFSRISEPTALLANEFAENLGVAFQIMDDILDITIEKNEAKDFGKSFGQDISEGKQTLILLYTSQEAGIKDKTRLLSILKRRTRQESAIREAVLIIKKYGAIEKARNYACRILRGSYEKLSKKLKPSWTKDQLLSYCDFITQRRS